MRLYRHILRAHAGPFVFSLAILMFIFLLQFIMKFIDNLVGKGLGGWVIAELIVLSLAWMVVLAVPMSVLVATLMAFGNMASANEVTAMKSSGMSLYHMMLPVIIMSVLIAFGVEQFNNKVLPEANHRLKTLTFDIHRKKPTLAINPGLFSQEISGYSILARKTFEQSNDLEGVTIYDYTNPAEHVTVIAEVGKISFTPTYRQLVMDLEEGEIHEVNAVARSEYRRLRFKKHRIVMNVEGFDFERTSAGTFGRGDRELSARDMLRAVDSIRRENAGIIENTRGMVFPSSVTSGIRMSGTQPFLDREIQDSPRLRALTKARNALALINDQRSYLQANRKKMDQFLVEIHKKYSIPVACIVFVFIGAPLGVMARRGSFGVAATLSLGFFLLYWSCLIGGEKLADRAIVSPWLGMWIANIFLGIVGAILTVRTAMESPQIRWSSVERLIPKALRSGQSDSTD